MSLLARRWQQKAPCLRLSLTVSVSPARQQRTTCFPACHTQPYSEASTLASIFVHINHEVNINITMNPMTNVKNITKFSEQELTFRNKTSWHDQYKDSAWIFVGGLPFDLTEGDVIAVFSQYGEIMTVNLIRDKDTGKQKGYGFVCYEDQRSTVLAVDNFNGIKILGRTIRVDHVSEYKMRKESEKDIGTTKETGEMRAARDAGDSRNMKDIRDTRDSRNTKDSRDTRNGRDTRDTRDIRDNRDSRNMKDIRDIRDSRETKYTRDSRDSRDTRDSRDNRDNRDTRKTRDTERLRREEYTSKRKR